LVDLVDGVKQLGDVVGLAADAPPSNSDDQGSTQMLEAIHRALSRIGDLISEAQTTSQGVDVVNTPPKIEVITQSDPDVDKLLRVLIVTMRKGIFPLIRNMNKRSDQDLQAYEKMKQVSDQLMQLESELSK
jgi:hypothetical protein